MLGGYHGRPPRFEGPASIPRLVQWFLEHDDLLRGPVWTVPEAVLEVQARVLELIRGAETEADFQAALDTLVQDVVVKTASYEDSSGGTTERTQAFLELRITEATARILGWIYLQSFGRKYREAGERSPDGGAAQIDYYNVVGVKPTATAHEIRRAYLDLVRQHHPDRGGNPRLMVLINEAYEVLSDPQKRAVYDRRYTEHVRARDGGPSVRSDPVRAAAVSSDETSRGPAEPMADTSTRPNIWVWAVRAAILAFLVLWGNHASNQPSRSGVPDPPVVPALRWPADVEAVVRSLVPDHLPVAEVIVLEPEDQRDVPTVILLVEPADVDAWFAELIVNPGAVSGLLRESGEAVYELAAGAVVQVGVVVFFNATTLPDVSPFDRLERVAEAGGTIIVLGRAAHDGTHAEVSLADLMGVRASPRWGLGYALDADQFMWTLDGRVAVVTGVVHNPTRYWHRVRGVTLYAYDAGGVPITQRPAEIFRSSLLPPGGSVGFEAAFDQGVNEFAGISASYDAKRLKLGFPLDPAPLSLASRGSRSSSSYVVTGSLTNPFQVPITAYLSIVLRDADGMAINGTTRQIEIGPAQSEPFEASFSNHLEWIDRHEVHAYWVPTQ